MRQPQPQQDPKHNLQLIVVASNLLNSESPLTHTLLVCPYTYTTSFGDKQKQISDTTTSTRILNARPRELHDRGSRSQPLWFRFFLLPFCYGVIGRESWVGYWGKRPFGWWCNRSIRTHIKTTKFMAILCTEKLFKEFYYIPRKNRSCIHKHLYLYAFCLNIKLVESCFLPPAWLRPR